MSDEELETIQPSHDDKSEGKMRQGSPSWGAIILLLILFWPIGLYLLNKRTRFVTKAKVALGTPTGRTVAIVIVTYIAFAVCVGSIMMVFSHDDYIGEISIEMIEDGYKPQEEKAEGNDGE